MRNPVTTSWRNLLVASGRTFLPAFACCHLRGRWRNPKRGEMSPNRRWRVRACASTHLRRRLGLFEDMLSSSQIHVMCSNSWLFRTWIPSTPSWITQFLSLFWPCPTLPNWSTPITESGLYIENLGDRSSYISNTCMFCPGMTSRYWLQVLLRV